MVKSYALLYSSVAIFSIFLPQPILGFCPRGCFCDHAQASVDCGSAGLKSIPLMLNPRTRSLVLSGNRISAVSLDELSIYSELQVLDLSHNGVVSIELGAFYRLSRLKVRFVIKTELGGLSLVVKII